MLDIFSQAPDFIADGYFEGRFVRFDSALHRGAWVVLFFYPQDFSRVCPTEIMELSRRMPEFAALGAHVAAISCDSEFSHRGWAEELGNVAVPLISDFEKNIAQAFGVLLPGGFPARATFILDPKGKVRHITVNPPEVGRSVAETLRMVEALQMGALIPADWHKGEPPISNEEHH